MQASYGLICVVKLLLKCLPEYDKPALSPVTSTEKGSGTGYAGHWWYCSLVFLRCVSCLALVRGCHQHGWKIQELWVTRCEGEDTCRCDSWSIDFYRYYNELQKHEFKLKCLLWPHFRLSLLAEILGVVLLEIPDTQSLTHLDIEILRNVTTPSETAFWASQVHTQMQFASQVNTLLNPAELFLFP